MHTMTDMLTNTYALNKKIKYKVIEQCKGVQTIIILSRRISLIYKNMHAYIFVNIRVSLNISDIGVSLAKANVFDRVFFVNTT